MTNPSDKRPSEGLEIALLGAPGRHTKRPAEAGGYMSRYDEQEYLDALVTLELAVKFAEREYRPANQAIRECWRSIRPRIVNDLNRRIFDGVYRQMFARGALALLRRQLDEACG